MAFSLGSWPDSDILVVVGSGPGGLGESEAILAALERQALAPALSAVLFDLRELEYIPTPDEGRQIGTNYGLFGAKHRCRMGYLAPPGAQYGIARMVQMISESHGASAAVLTSAEAAVAWLCGDVHALGA